jgi:hypothetical protein
VSVLFGGTQWRPGFERCGELTFAFAEVDGGDGPGSQPRFGRQSTAGTTTRFGECGKPGAAESAESTGGERVVDFGLGRAAERNTANKSGGCGGRHDRCDFRRRSSLICGGEAVSGLLTPVKA